LIVNGKNMDFPPGTTVAKMLETLDINQGRVVVQVNLKIVPKDQYGQTRLNSDDKVEIIGFVGGG